VQVICLLRLEGCEGADKAKDEITCEK
jgi:hypothetical protein